MKTPGQLREELRREQQRLAAVDREAARLRERVADLNRQVSRAEGATKLRVTDHAVLRLLERHGDVDVEAVREALRDQVAAAYAVAGPGKYPLPCGGRAVVSAGGIIVTVEE